MILRICKQDNNDSSKFGDFILCLMGWHSDGGGDGGGGSPGLDGSDDGAGFSMRKESDSTIITASIAQGARGQVRSLARNSESDENRH